MDLYERGRFDAAASAYRAALAALASHLADDLHCRAALHANIAACLRRDKRPADAVAECDCALRLLPRFGRALFRKGASLLEAGQPSDAIAALEALYRVDRDWPRLSDWLLRAHAAQRRNGEGGGGGGGPPRGPGSRGSGRRSFSSSRSDGGGGGGGGGARGDGPSAAPPGRGGEGEAERIASESDHYVVLGVTCDATDKQIQQAYRLRSLKFHPDRKNGSTSAFQRIAQAFQTVSANLCSSLLISANLGQSRAQAFQTLSDADKRSMYDQGVDVKSRRGGGESGSEDDEEEHRQSLREEIERKYYPERYEFWPFGDPFVHKRKRAERMRRQQGQRAWYEED